MKDIKKGTRRKDPVRDESPRSAPIASPASVSDSDSPTRMNHLSDPGASQHSVVTSRARVALYDEAYTNNDESENKNPNIPNGS